MQACSSLAEPFGQRKTVKSIIAFHGIQSFTKRSRFLSWRRAYNFSTEHSSLCVKFSTQSFRIPIIKQACDHRCLASLNQGPQSDDNTPEAEKVLEASVSDSWKWTMTRDELVAYALLLVAVSTVPLLQGYQWSASFHFLFLAIWSVYVGSHRSLRRSPPQRMSFKQGLAIPVFSSFTLFGFYCLLRFFPDFDVRTFISAYLALVGALAVGNNLVEPLRLLFSKTYSPSWQFDLPRWLVQEDGATIHITLTPADIVAGLVGIGVSVASKQVGASFSLNNFIAVCIVTELLQLLSLGSFMTAAAMLCGLLLYDVFWVFGSSHIFGDNVMVTVATSSSFDGPMKLIFPQVKANASNAYSILGLGDIAVPGLLTALMLRFDRARSQNPHKECQEHTSLLESVDEGLISESSPDKTYFITCVVSYIVGLAVTVAHIGGNVVLILCGILEPFAERRLQIEENIANSVSGAPQPALLYLVPCLLLGVLLTASLRSESSLLLNYKDEVIRGSIGINAKNFSRDSAKRAKQPHV